MMNRKEQTLCDKERCTGCGACMNICPNGAISMKKDLYGFEHPFVDRVKCDNCLLCVKTCPEQNPPSFSAPIKVYAAYAMQDSIRRTSTSGGIARILSEYVMQSNGEVYAHSFSENFDLMCRKIASEKDLDRCAGSKYVQSSIVGSLKNLREDLAAGKKVLFIGTPCQVAAIENLVANYRNNLITVSFICGGVPSISFFKDYISNLKIYDDIEDIRFRNNNEYGLYGINNSEIVFYKERWKCEYLIGFDEHIIQRESCFRCQYAKTERIGDITIGDFWGIDSINNSARDISIGVSLCMITSEKGYGIIKELHENDLIWLEEHSLDQAIKCNPRLLSALERKNEVDLFRKLYISKGFVNTINKLYGNKYRIRRLKRLIKKYFNRVICHE